MKDAPVSGFRKFWRQKLASLKYERHAITNKYTEAIAVVQKELGDVENLARCKPAKVGETLSGPLL
jgi:hypothetical protein